MNNKNDLCSSSLSGNISESDLIKQLRDASDYMDILSDSSYERKQAYEKVLKQVVPQDLTNNIQNALDDITPKSLGIPTDELDMLADTMDSLQCLSDAVKVGECLTANSTDPDFIGPIKPPTSPIGLDDILKLPGDLKGALNEMGGFPELTNINWSLSLFQADFGLPEMGEASKILTKLQDSLGDMSILKDITGIVDMLKNDVVGALSGALAELDLDKFPIKELPIIGQAQELMKELQPLTDSIQQIDGIIEKVVSMGSVNPLIQEVMDKVSGNVDKFGFTDKGCFDHSKILNDTLGRRTRSSNSIISNLTSAFDKSQEIKTDVIQKYDTIINTKNNNNFLASETTGDFNFKSNMPTLPSNISMPSNILDTIPSLDGIIDTSKAKLSELTGALDGIPNLDLKVPDIKEKIGNVFKECNLPAIGMNEAFKGSAINPPVFTQANDYFRSPSSMDDVISSISTVVPTSPRYVFPDAEAEYPTPYDNLMGSPDYEKDLTNFIEEKKAEKGSWVRENPDVGESWALTNKDEISYGKRKLSECVKVVYLFLDRVSKEDQIYFDPIIKESVQKNILKNYESFFTKKDGIINIIFTIMYIDKYKTPLDNLIFEVGIQLDVIDMHEVSSIKKIITDVTPEFETETYRKSRLSIQLNSSIQELYEKIYPSVIESLLEDDISAWVLNGVI